MAPRTSHITGEPTFGTLLREFRTRAGLTQEALAERAGLSARGISDLERGLKRAPRRDTVALLLEALVLSPVEREALEAARAPRPEAVPGRDARLPVAPTPLVGREREVAAVVDLLGSDDVRLVTLVGPGGVGKTRLALAAAHRLGERFVDGAVFADLAPVRDPALVLPTVAAALGVRDTGARTLADSLAIAIGTRHLLLVLDNCEQVVRAAPEVAALLAVCPALRILATSRVVLRIAAEQVVPVLPLALPDRSARTSLPELARSEAVALFVARARAAEPAFGPTAATAEAIAALVHRLDGLPLAIELAAARIRALPPATLLARLDRRLPLLTGGARDAPARQRTMRDAIAWSYDLLAPDERVICRWLSVFAGGFTLEAAEAVAATARQDVDVLAGLAALVDASLLHRLAGSDDEPRFGMLETVREFAQDQLAASGEDVTLRGAHAAYFLALAEHAKPHLSAADQGAWLRRLEAEHPNIRVALATLAASDDHDAYLRLAANLGVFWWMRAHLAEGRLHLEHALARAAAPTPHRAEALTGIGRIVTSQGDLAAGETWLRQGEALARSLDVPGLLWQALFERGQAAEYADDDARAVPLYEAALAVARELNDAQAASVPLWALSEVAYGRGDLETSGRLGEEAIALLRSGGDEFMLSLCLVTRGGVALGWGDLPRAVVAYQEALELALGIEMQWVVAGALAGFAAVAAARGHHVAAAGLLGAAATIREASHQDRFANFYHHAQTTQAVRAAVGEAAFVAAWEAGRAMPAEEAVDLPRSLGLLEKGGPCVPTAR